ncbi:methyl-accepting chemotaxis protein [Chitinimonas lacunae]|uniref:Methyl-accepting chemotaxis protein n=1 Tax=Chitinimonas lacunae TaxID=1963018 RepID=A0ABV8MMM9_9NEIS
MALSIVFNAGMLLLVAYLIAGFASDLNQRSSRLEREMARLSEGDFSAVSAQPGEDELGHVATSARMLTEKLGATLREIRAGASELMGAATDIAGVSTQVAASTNEQNNAAAAMAAAVEELTVSINHMAGNAEEVQQASAESGRMSSEGGVVIERTVESMRRIAESVRNASGSVSALGRDAEAISGFVRIIKDIADQTSLLALNAAIEAARAGESGRGFAVVADEVRKLAERSADATDQIASLVQRIQGNTQGVVERMEDGVQQVEGGVELAAQAGEAIGQIRRSSASVVNSVREIRDSLKEQSAVANDVAGQVETIAQMSTENTHAAESSASTAQQLRTLALELERRVAVFRLG